MAETRVGRRKLRKYSRAHPSIGATCSPVLSLKPARDIAAFPADCTPVKPLFWREFPQNCERREHPLATPRETGNMMGGENFIPWRDLLVHPLRKENSTGENTRGSDGPRSGCDAVHDDCDS